MVRPPDVDTNVAGPGMDIPDFDVGKVASLGTDLKAMSHFF
jgi:hypothetical protein